MKGYVQDIEAIATGNEDFRRVPYTARNCQLVVMALKPQEKIGAEVRKLDQFFRVEAGRGEAMIDGITTPIQTGLPHSCLQVPGTTSSTHALSP